MLKNTRFVFTRIILALFVAGNTSAQKLDADGLPSLKGKRVLIVYGGWKGHSPKEFVDKISPWLKQEGAIITLSDSLEIYTHKPTMDEADLIIQSWTMDKITRPQANGLLQAIKNGTGFAGCHGGTGDSFRDNVDFQYMVGGQWVSHPGRKYEYKVDITNSGDPVSKGLSDFNIHTEQYYMHVDPNVKVLATTTFNGDHDDWINSAVIPVAWKKYFSKGRVFYLSIGHAPKNFDVPEAWALLTRGIRWASGSKYQPTEDLLSPVYPSHTKVNKWVDLIDDDLSAWDVFMGAPHTSTDIKGYKKFDDVTKGTPIGLNKDPKNVFTVIQEDDEKVIRISGEIFAGLVTKSEYENYHLKWDFKWGDKKWEPRLNEKRNSGILFHSVGEHTDFWNVWMTSLEYEVQENDCGDFITIGAVRAKVPAIKNGNKYTFTPKADTLEFSWKKYGGETGRCSKPGDPEKPHGEWNTMDLYCLGNTSIFAVNDKVVMVVIDPEVRIDGVWKPMTKGKIQIQSESAEIFYKNMKIKSISSFPLQIKQLVGIKFD